MSLFINIDQFLNNIKIISGKLNDVNVYNTKNFERGLKCKQMIVHNLNHLPVLKMAFDKYILRAEYEITGYNYNVSWLLTITENVHIPAYGISALKNKTKRLPYNVTYFVIQYLESLKSHIQNNTIIQKIEADYKDNNNVNYVHMQLNPDYERKYL